MGPQYTSDDVATKRALLAIKQLQAKIETLEYTRSEPIALIGMGCRFPGGANNPEQFWALLRDGVDATTEIPKERWNSDVYYNPDPDAAGHMYVRRASLLDQVVGFDTDLFGISPREAEMLDPQQRLVLEVSWEALERAAIPPTQLRNSQTGIFIGSEHHDYLHLAYYPLSEANVYTCTGNMPSMDSGRLAYFLGTQGPTLTVDTACSASLVAIHLAVQSLRMAECDLALAGGVNLILAPHMSILGSRARALAPDGRSKAFAATANGYGRGEGCGMLVLKRLSDAGKNHDRILAVIRGSAVNHDGHSSGLTVPNGVSQQKLIRQALVNANVAPGDVGYIETHGTGTLLGDPIEVEALHAVFGERMEPLVIGSVKTNIGHLEAAAGVAGMIKTVLAIQYGQIPQHLHFSEPNPHVPWDQLSMVVPTMIRPWPRPPDNRQRVAGVSSFSLSGTNAHVIVEEPPTPPTRSPAVDRPLHLLTLSAKTMTALRALAQQYAQHLTDQQPSVDPAEEGWRLGDLCFTTHVGRAHFAHRLSMVAASLDQVHTALAAFSRGEMPVGLANGETAFTPPKIAFLFTGQGSQYIDMGRHLYETQPIFRQALNRCDDILRPYLGKSLLPLLYPENRLRSGRSALDETAYTQPALFALEYALAQLWLSWGIRPEVVMGHSVGEYVAACIAGVFSLEEGLMLIAARGQLMGALPQDGAMVAVAADAQWVAAVIAPFCREVAIAAVNGPQNVVISGTAARVQALAADFQGAGIKTIKLSISHAFYSPLMEPMLAEFTEIARAVKYALPQIELVSNLTGELASTDITTPDYWCRHIWQPVRFADGMQTLRRQDCTIFIEIGPKPTLLGMGRQCLECEAPTRSRIPHSALWLPSLSPSQDEWQAMLSALGHLYVHGIEINWAQLYAGQPYRRAILPTYPFQRRRHWIKRHADGYREASTAIPQTPLIDLLHKGDVQRLTALLEGSGDYSEEQRKILPQIADILVQQQQLYIADRGGLETPDIAERLYAIEWRVMQRQERSLPVLATDAWLILADQMGVGDTLAELLQEHRQTCYLVYASNTYSRQGVSWTLDPGNLDHFHRLLAEIAGPLQGVVHLWGLDTTKAEALTAPDLDTAQRLTCASTLHLMQALHRRTLQPRLWFATQGAVAVDNDVVAVAQGSLWGLSRVIALEAPHLWGGIFDLNPQGAFTDPTARYEAAATLLTELWDAQGEDQLVFRARQRYAARLVRTAIDPALPQMPVVRADATYLITGGLGALGLQLARWLVAQGARHLVLTGRRGMEGKQELVDRLGADAEIRVLKADVARDDDVATLLADIRATLPPLRGIIHAAGALDDGILLQQNWARFQGVMAPKVAGSWNLYTQTRSIPLDFLVFFSSGAGLLGSSGQGNYAAANAFMDALAAYGRGQGAPLLSICWGSWGGAGMGEQAAAPGERSIAPGVAMRTLQQLLARLVTRSVGACVGVIDMDWPVFADSFQTPPPFLSVLVQAPSATQTTLIPQLRSAQPSERHDLLRRHLKTEVARVLGSQELPDERRGFFDMGMDSLMALQLSNRIQASLEVAFPSTLVFEYPNVDALTDYLLEKALASHAHLTSDILSPTGDAAAADAAGQGDDITLIQQMSQAELEALIDREIAEFGGMDK